MQRRCTTLLQKYQCWRLHNCLRNRLCVCLRSRKRLTQALVVSRMYWCKAWRQLSNQADQPGSPSSLAAFKPPTRTKPSMPFPTAPNGVDPKRAASALSLRQRLQTPGLFEPRALPTQAAETLERFWMREPQKCPCQTARSDSKPKQATR